MWLRLGLQVEEAEGRSEYGLPPSLFCVGKPWDFLLPESYFGPRLVLPRVRERERERSVLPNTSELKIKISWEVNDRTKGQDGQNSKTMGFFFSGLLSLLSAF